MTQQDFVSHLTARGWDKMAATSCYSRPIIDKSLNIDTWRRTFVGAFCSRSDAVCVVQHMADCLRKDIPVWNDLTLPNLADFKEYLTQKVASNSAAVYMRTLSALMNIYIDHIPNRGFKSAMRVRKEPSQHVALSEHEVERIHNYKPRSVTEHDIKRNFMLECLCGARAIDIGSLSRDNIRDGWLTYVSQKTKTETSVPVHKNLLQYIDDKPLKEPCQLSVVNRTLKRIAMRCGIDEEVKVFVAGRWQTRPKWQLVSTHTARRSFATQLAIRGVPVPTIAKLMGHSDVKMTSRYICIDRKDIGDTAMAFFN